MKKLVWMLACLLAAALLFACGGGDDSDATGSETGGETASETVSETAADTEGIRIGYASALDPNDIADQFGIQSAGGEVITLNDDSAVIAGLQRGDIDVGNIDFNQAVSARANGMPIKIIYVSQRTPEYVMVGRPEIKSLEDLAGKRVGHQGPGTQTLLFAQNLVKEQAPDIYDDVEFLALPESSRRAQALAANRLDASPVESINLAALMKEGDFNNLGTWADLQGDAGQAIGTAWITTDEIYEEQKDRLEAFVKELQKGYNKAYADKEAWIALAESELSDIDHSLLPDVYDIYIEREMYPKAGEPALTEEIFEANDTFYRSLGEWDEPQDGSGVAFDLIEAGASVQDK